MVRRGSRMCVRLRLFRVLHVLHTRKTCQFLLFGKFYLHVTTASREGQWNLSKSVHAMEADRDTMA